MMKHCLLLLSLLSMLTGPASGQDSLTGVARRFAFTGSVQFHAIAFPFRDAGANFNNPGLSAGVEMSLNKKHSLFQQLHLAGYLNRDAGNGFRVYTQTAFRQSVTPGLYAEVRLGAGWQRIYHPVPAYVFDDGGWKETPAGKSQVIIPLGISAGYEWKKFSLFAGYQIIPALFYDQTIPLNFYTMYEAGFNIPFTFKKAGS